MSCTGRRWRTLVAVWTVAWGAVWHVGCYIAQVVSLLLPVDLCILSTLCLVAGLGSPAVRQLLPQPVLGSA